MPAIGTIGSVVTVTPCDEIQVVYGPGDHEFIDDRSPFTLTVDGLLEADDQVIGVYGRVTSGHDRYRNQIATLVVRLDGSDWRRDNQSVAGFRIAKSVARPNGRFPVYHPYGVDIEGYPFIIRYGEVDARLGGEPAINSAMNHRLTKNAEPGEGGNSEHRGAEEPPQ